MSAAPSSTRTRLWPAAVRGAIRRAPGAALGGARRIPVTMTAVFVLLVMGVVTGTLFHPLDPETGLLRQLSFGAPAIRDGHWWTFATGAIVLPRPEFYLAVGALLILAVGAYERRVGAARTAVALVGTQLFATVAAALAFLPMSSSGWAWAQTLSHQIDLGLSAGAIGIAGAASALLSETWRRRVRAAGLAYLSIILFRSGLLWDVEHLLAFVSGVLIGPKLAGRGRLPFNRQPLSAVRIRYGVAVLVACTGAASLVETMYPGLGGMFGSGRPTHSSMHNFALQLGEAVVFLLVADGLRRGRAAAWWLASIGTGVSLVNAIANTRGALQIADIASTALVLGILLAFRNAWEWRTPDGFALRSLTRVGMAVATFGAAWMTLIWAVRGHLDPKPGIFDALRQTMSEFTFNPGPLRAHGGLFHALFGVLAVFWAITLIGLLIPWIYADRGPEHSPRESLRKLLRTYGGGSLGWMRTWPAFTSWTTRDGRTAISYCVVGTVAIAIGDPVGRENDFPRAVSEFKQFCAYAGWTPCWFAATATLVEAACGSDSTAAGTSDGSARTAPWKAVQIGEDTVMALGDLTFTGKQWQDIRTARNRAGREGIRIITGRLADFPAELGERIERISREWVSAKALPEMGFTLGTVEHALDPEIRTHVALDGDDQVQGVTTWLPVYENGAVIGWTLDLMRRRPDGFRPVMEYLIAESALLFQAEGYRQVSLSVAPLARRTQITGTRTMLDRTLDLLSGLLEPTYGFQSLLAFKAKFQPEFKPVYLVYTGMAELASISLAIGRAYLPNLDTRQAAMLLRGLRRSHAGHAPVGAAR